MFLQKQGLIEYVEQGSQEINSYDSLKNFFDRIYEIMKPGIADDYTVDEFVKNISLFANKNFFK